MRVRPAGASRRGCGRRGRAVGESLEGDIETSVVVTRRRWRRTVLESGWPALRREARTASASGGSSALDEQREGR